MHIAETHVMMIGITVGPKRYGQKDSMSLIIKTDPKPSRVKRLANGTYVDIDNRKIPPIQQQA